MWKTLYLNIFTGQFTSFFSIDEGAIDMLNKNIIGANILANGQDFLIFNVGIVYYTIRTYSHTRVLSLFSSHSS